MESISKSRIYSGAKFCLERWSAGSGDAMRQWDIVVHPGAAVILPWLDETRIVLIRNWRVTAGSALLELPAGTLAPPESPLAAAGRELEEETGYRAGSISQMFSFYSTPGCSTEVMHVFEARDLAPGPMRLEADEQIHVAVMEYDLALREVERGGIVDAKTMLTLLYHDRFRRGREARR